jgi:phosphohistidine phosphatase
MKTLLLLRHAQTSSGSPTGRDLDRPLLEAGRRAASLVGQLLRRKHLAPDVVISSPATRARETAELICEAAQLVVPLRFDARIYEASAEQLSAVVSEVEGGAQVILLVGHNPGLQELLARLTGEHAPMLPATLARIDLDIDAWNAPLTTQAARLIFALPEGKS